MVRYIQYIKLMFYTPGPYLIMFILQDVFDNIFNVSIRVIVFFMLLPHLVWLILNVVK